MIVVSGFYYFLFWTNYNMQLLRILSNNMTHGSNITDKGAIVGARGALVGNFVIPKYVTGWGAVVRQPKNCLNKN